MGVMDTEVVIVLLFVCVAAGIGIGVGVSPTVPRDFSCTESAVIEGSATCVKYERSK